MSNRSSHVLVTGAAGFIGSHLTDALLQSGHSVVGIDNLSRGRTGNLDAASQNPNFHFYQADVLTPNVLDRIFEDYSIAFVWHLIANSDISAGVIDPSVDLRDTFMSSYQVLEAMRRADATHLAFASTSAIYGVHSSPVTESTGPLLPISNYGAMKLASEALISAAAESFLEKVWIFRFPNVVGARATHGIIFDLLSKLESNSELEVLGNGTQQKPYMHVSELISAMRFIVEKSSEKRNYFNIGPSDAGVKVSTIAEAVVRTANPAASIRYTGGDRGWVGDVPRFQYSTEKLAQLGWSPRLDSAAAIETAVQEIYSDFQSKKQTT